MQKSLSVKHLFNTDKCEVLQFGKSNHGRALTVNGRTLGSKVEQRERGEQEHGSVNDESQIGQ